MSDPVVLTKREEQLLKLLDTQPFHFTIDSVFDAGRQSRRRVDRTMAAFRALINKGLVAPERFKSRQSRQTFSITRSGRTRATQTVGFLDRWGGAFRLKADRPDLQFERVDRMIALTAGLCVFAGLLIRAKSTFLIATAAGFASIGLAAAGLQVAAARIAMAGDQTSARGLTMTDVPAELKGLNAAELKVVAAMHGIHGKAPQHSIDGIAGASGLTRERVIRVLQYLQNQKFAIRGEVMPRYSLTRTGRAVAEFTESRLRFISGDPKHDRRQNRTLRKDGVRRAVMQAAVAARNGDPDLLVSQADIKANTGLDDSTLYCELSNLVDANLLEKVQGDDPAEVLYATTTHGERGVERLDTIRAMPETSFDLG